MIKEFSAGGLISKDKKLLMILMKTINGNAVWTFPKGHIEENENPQTAALREVYEETGVRCEIVDKKEFFISHYFFVRNKTKVEKKVYWYLMRPLEETQKILTPDEIEEVKWFEIDEALKISNYQSDRDMIEKWRIKWNLKRL
jgi:8-oxo-dGTP pyrophosphatase MutT (NUDIX family)